MRHSIKLSLKKILRIVLFGLGGLLTIISLLVIMGIIFQKNANRSESIPVFAIALVTLVIGIGIYSLAPKLPKTSSKLKLLSQEERFIENLRRFIKRRRLLDTLLVFLIIFILSCLIFSFWQSKKLDSLITPGHIRTMATFENPKQELPILFYRFYNLARLRTILLFRCYFFAILLGIFIGVLINEIGGLYRNRHRLTISMWERIQKLENEVEELRTPPLMNGSTVTEPDHF